MELKTKIKLFFYITALGCSYTTYTSSKPIFIEPFDLGGGGTVITKANKSSTLANNPALLAFGIKKIRWIGSRTSIKSGEGSTDFAKNIASGKSSNSTEIIDAIFKNPINFGVSQNLSLIMKNFGIGAYSSFHSDFKLWKYGSPEDGSGTSSITIHSDTIAAVLASTATTVGFDWLALGFTGKHLTASENVINVDLLDPDVVKKTQQKLTNLTPKFDNSKTNIDTGLLVFLQNERLDFSFGLTAINILSKESEAEEHVSAYYKRVYNAGFSITLHSNKHSLNVAIDYRDIKDINKQNLWKKTHLGTKLIISNYLGLSAGVYNGSPSYGFEVDLFVFKISGSTYTKEYHKTPGVNPRKIYILNLALGSYF